MFFGKPAKTRIFKKQQFINKHKWLNKALKDYIPFFNSRKFTVFLVCTFGWQYHKTLKAMNAAKGDCSSHMDLNMKGGLEIWMRPAVSQPQTLSAGHAKGIIITNS